MNSPVDAGSRDCESQTAMSFIPFNAISGGPTAAQRQTNDQVGARQVQSRKNFHHAEDVDELDDTAVDSVRDQQERQGRGKNPDKHRAADEPEEKVEITALVDTPATVKRKPPKPASGLDISA
jgi:hypothetical protein